MYLCLIAYLCGLCAYKYSSLCIFVLIHTCFLISFPVRSVFFFDISKLPWFRRRDSRVVSGAFSTVLKLFLVDKLSAKAIEPSLYWHLVQSWGNASPKVICVKVTRQRFEPESRIPFFSTIIVTLATHSKIYELRVYVNT